MLHPSAATAAAGSPPGPATDPGPFLDLCKQFKASDLHLSSGKAPSVRVDGDILFCDHPALTPVQVDRMLAAITTPEQHQQFLQDREIDFAISVKDSRFRVNAFLTTDGPAIVMRTIATKVPTLEELGAPDVFRQLATRSKGLVLVTGQTGSGKSTTIAAMIAHINATQEVHILTIEDPIEYMHGSNRALVNQREVGKHTHSFNDALRSALREDPDVILVGELRDLETISLALTAAETGHLVLGTLHTSSAAKAVDRIIDVFPSSDKNLVRAQIATSIQGVIAQNLLKRVGGGRVAAYEIMIGTPAIRNLIREAKIPQIESMMQLGSKHGMQTMRDAIVKLIDTGMADPSEAEALLSELDAERSVDDSTPTGAKRPGGYEQAATLSLSQGSPPAQKRGFAF